MFKEAKMMFIYTESSLHCGSGTSLGVIDLPIQREKYTDYPVCQASGIKGVVREWFENRHGEKDDKVIKTFGPDFGREDGEAHTGAATFTDGRLLLFPVRSLNGVFAYTTSRFALNRLKRDLQMAGLKDIAWKVPDDSGDKILGTDNAQVAKDKKVVLEEYTFDFEESKKVTAISQWIADNAIPNGGEYKFWIDKAKKDIVLLPDNAFRDFVKLSTEVQARIQIDNTTKTVKHGALFYEEALPSDSLLYSIILAHNPACDSDKRPDKLKNQTDVMTYLGEIHKERLQFGGDATIGKGIVNVNFLNGRG